mgnify:CR=1 FL=1
MEIKYTARAEYSSGHAISGYGCVSFTSEAAATAWAAEQIQSDPGAVVTVWKAYTADIHRIYKGR